VSKFFVVAFLSLKTLTMDRSFELPIVSNFDQALSALVESGGAIFIDSASSQALLTPSFFEDRAAAIQTMALSRHLRSMPSWKLAADHMTSLISQWSFSLSLPTTLAQWGIVVGNRGRGQSTIQDLRRDSWP
jgi:hypothetical protein